MVDEGTLTLIQSDCLKLLALSGALLGEIHALKWTEIDFERRMIVLRQEAGGSNRPKTIPRSDAALAIITRTC